MEQEIIRLDLGGVNCYLGREGDKFILFDTGGHLFMDKEYNNRRKLLEKELTKQGCNSLNLQLIVLTHGDNDHVTNAAYVAKTYNAKIAMHAEDVSLVNHPTLELVMENCKYRSLIFQLIFRIMKKSIKKLMKKILMDFENFIPDVLLEDGFDLSEYGLSAKVVHMPGHTKGSIGIITEQGDFISGDVFANSGKPDIAPNANNFKVLAESIKKLEKMKIKVIYPGHGEPFDAKVLFHS